MRLVLLMLSLFVLAACSTPDSEQGDIGPHDCVSPWPTYSRVLTPQLLSPTIEERVAGKKGVALVTLESVSFRLPGRAQNNRLDLGEVNLKFAVLDNLKTESSYPEFVGATIRVDYHCEYIADDERDSEALARISANVEEDLMGKNLIVFYPYNQGIYMSSVVNFPVDQQGNPEPPESRYYFSREWLANHPWLMESERIGSDQDPYFVDPLRSLNARKVPENVISLSEIRDKAQAIFAEEIERGVDCVGADYRHQWYLRSGEENWYRGLLSKDGTPVECFAAIP